MRMITVAWLLAHWLLPIAVAAADPDPSEARGYTQDDFRTLAAAALSRSAQAEDFDDLADAFKRATPYRRYYLALAIGRTGDPRGIALLRAAMLQADRLHTTVRKPGGPAVGNSSGQEAIQLPAAYSAALIKLGDRDWPTALLPEYRKIVTDESEAAEVISFFIRYGELPIVKQSFEKDEKVRRLIGETFLDASLDDALRLRACEAGMWRNDMASYGSAHLNERLALGQSIDPRSFHGEGQRTSRTLTEQAFDWLLQGATKEDMPLLRQCADASDVYRWRIVSHGRIAAWDVESYMFVLQCAASSVMVEHQEFQNLIKLLKPQYAEALLADAKNETLPVAHRDRMILLLATVGDRRAIPLIAARIGAKDSHDLLMDAASLMPEKEYIAPLEASLQEMAISEKRHGARRERGVIVGNVDGRTSLKIEQDSVTMKRRLIHVLVQLKDKRAIDMIVDDLAGERCVLDDSPDAMRYLPPPPAPPPHHQPAYHTYHWLDLGKMYNDIPPSVMNQRRHPAAFYLAEMKAKDTAPRLVAMLEKELKRGEIPWPGDRSRAAWILMALGAVGAEQTPALAQQMHAVAPRSARQAMVMLNSDAGFAALRQMATARLDPAVAAVLARRGDDAGVEYIIDAALKDQKGGLKALEEFLMYGTHAKARQTMIELVKRPAFFNNPPDRPWNGNYIGLRYYTPLPEAVPAMIAAYQRTAAARKDNREKYWIKEGLMADLIAAIGCAGGRDATKFLFEVVTTR